MSKERRLRSKHRQLDELYAKLPKFQCKGKCGSKVCYAIAMTETERDRIYDTVGYMEDTASHCAYFNESDGRCMAHAVRPMICRIWGLTEESRMTCPWGCEPERRLTIAEAQQFIRESQRIGGKIVTFEGGFTIGVEIEDGAELEDIVWTPCQQPECKQYATGFMYDPKTGYMTDARCTDHITDEMWKSILNTQQEENLLLPPNKEK